MILIFIDKLLILSMEMMTKSSSNYSKSSRNISLSETSRRLSTLLNNTNIKNIESLQKFGDHLAKENRKIIDSETKSANVKHDLGLYFKNLMQYITDDMIVLKKKFQQLRDGLYILVKGRVCYVWAKQLDIQKKQNLFNAAKSGIFSLHRDPCSLESEQEYSILLESPMTIIQCQHENCIVVEDSILIRIQPQVRRDSKFDQLYQERCKLIDNCHINGQYQNQGSGEDKMFFLNMKLHNSFVINKYFFHQSVSIQTLGIVRSGILKPTKNEGKRYFQLQRYALVLPGIKYEVISTEAEILIIQRNHGLVYFHPELRQAHKRMKERSHEFYQSDYSFFHSSKKRKYSKSQQSNKLSSDVTLNMKRWEINKRNKLLTNITKAYYHQLIIPMITCTKTFQLSENQLQKVKSVVKNELKIKRYRKPKVLFDYNKQSPKTYQSFHAVLEQVENRNCDYVNKKTEILKKERKERKTFNQRDHYLSRYENVSKQLFDKFMSTKTAYHDFCRPILHKQKESN